MDTTEETTSIKHEKPAPKMRRKYGVIKKTFVSVEEAEKEKQDNEKKLEERKKVNLGRTLKIETPWTTCSSDEGSKGYLYYKIQQARKNKTAITKYDRVFSFLEQEKVVQIDFHGLLREAVFNKDNSAIFRKAQTLTAENQLSSKPSSLLMRRKLKLISS
uniref:Uncharacterized protein n=1 Tax=Euplotes harpa TaxID=151035 RepID=A0A7S3NA45_9SPIT|mmetsp:Transcript_23397/g.26813  ORF Transcript_23397/g.26813 Transcript_23397/m.26813 type:complete len:160 (+) Transcript_23397:50-529(+)